jgi:hypothetical protein
VAYAYGRPAMIGFTGGGSTYGARAAPMIMPVVGDWTVPPDYAASYYDKSTEKASPGYYAVDLATFHTRAELTVTQWTSLMRFTFPASHRSNVVVNLRRAGGDVEVVGDHTIRGVDTGNHGNRDADGRISWPSSRVPSPRSARSTPNVNDKGEGLGHEDVQTGQRKVTGNYAGAYVTFDTKDGDQVLVRIAHGHSADEADQRLHADGTDANFDSVHAKARAAWAQLFDRVEVTGGTPKQRALFYSTLYHSFASPRVVARKGEQYTDANGQLKVAAYDLYSPVPYWDTGRNQIALLMLLQPEGRAGHHAFRAGTGTRTRLHEHLVPRRPCRLPLRRRHAARYPFDYAGAYEVLRKNATDPKGPRGYLAEYDKNGWISDIVPPGNPSPPYAGGKAGVATTLEYAGTIMRSPISPDGSARKTTPRCSSAAPRTIATCSILRSASSAAAPRTASGFRRSIRPSRTTTS